MPILEGILIQTNDGEVKLTTYDLEIGIEYIIDADVKEQGATVVNAIMFSEIIRKLPDTDINISFLALVIEFFLAWIIALISSKIPIVKNFAGVK